MPKSEIIKIQKTNDGYAVVIKVNTNIYLDTLVIVYTQIKKLSDVWLVNVRYYEPLWYPNKYRFGNKFVTLDELKNIDLAQFIDLADSGSVLPVAFPSKAAALKVARAIAKSSPVPW